jgi:hypothetical protein
VSQPTVRERVRGIYKLLCEAAMTADLARESEAELTGLWGYCLESKRKAELDYYPVLLACKQSAVAANRAEIEAKCTPQYAALREAEDFVEMAKQGMTTCRGYLRSLDTERKFTR